MKNPFRRALLRCAGRRYLSFVEGRATVKGSKHFCSQLDSLYHVFNKSGLCINPIIHGPPKLSSDAKTDYDKLIAKAVSVNKQNALFVYSQHPTQGTWFTPCLQDLLRTTSEFSRNDLVLFASVSVPKSVSGLISTLDEALSLCSITNLDYVILQCDETTFSRPEGLEAFEEAINVLEEVCAHGDILHGYGFHVTVPPYCFHKPTNKSSNNLMMVPPTVEDTIRTRLQHADLVMYDISPTIAIPATFPMLDPNPDVWIDPDKDTDEASETNRKLTRIAAHPFTCRLGVGRDSLPDPHAMFSSRVKLLKPADMKPLMPNDVDVDDDSDIDDKEEEEQEDVSDIEQTLQQAYSDEVARLKQQQIEGKSKEITLISGKNSPHVEKQLAAHLNKLCPLLLTSPKLEEKALRIAFSVGIDAVVVDADLSASLGRITLSQRMLLSSMDSDDVWESFSIENVVGGN